MAADVFSIIVAMILCGFFALFAQFMIEVKPMKCPWEQDRELIKDNQNFESKSRHDWKDFKPMWGAEDLHHAG